MQQVKLSITENYVSHWSWWQGVRELIQNAVDTGAYTVEFGDNDVVITSHGGKVPMGALLLGKTTKAEDKSSIGKFGEGMKLGFLVLTRMGAQVSMTNFDELWVPEMAFDEVYGENVLAVNIETPAFLAANNQVQIVVSGIPLEAVSEIKSKFAPAQSLEVVIENRRGKAYAKKDDRKGCRLYVKGIFVTEVPGKFKFDYDFMPEAFVLDRDRDSANTFEVKYEAANLIKQSEDILLLAELATENYADLEEFRGTFKGWSTQTTVDEGDSYGYTLSEKAAMVFRDKNGDDAFPINSQWEGTKKRVVSQQAVKAGMFRLK